MNILATHTVPELINGIRLSEYAIGIFPGLPTRNGVKKAIGRGLILVDGAPGQTATWVRGGHRIELVEGSSHARPVYECMLPVVYEDEHVAVINKPAGIPVSGNAFRTVENTLPYSLVVPAARDGRIRPRPVHRIDAQTSGLLLIAKTAPALIDLCRGFESRQIKKRYRAIVIGSVDGPGGIDDPIDGREAITEYAPVRCVSSLRSGVLTLVDLFPQTGRTHQLRRHMAQISHPILGDSLYGPENIILRGKGLFLAAVDISFVHPVHGGSMSFTIDEPRKFHACLDREARRWETYRAAKYPT